jgi:hypothetical protein
MQPSHRTTVIRPAGRRAFYPIAVAASVAVAAVSLVVVPSGVGYDPWSWLIWGRELAHGQLTTSGAASSFKPLPVMFTTLFAFTGSVEPKVWLVIARAGAVMALIVAFHLGSRLRGRVAGAIAAVGVLTSLQYASYLIPAGMSEPTGAAFCLAAVDAHLSRRRWMVILMLFGAGLVRIEIWAFMAAYGVWWVVRDSRRRGWAVVGVVGLLIALPLAWFLPDLITTGDALRSATAATHESQGGPLLSRYPGLASLRDATTVLIAPLSVAWAVEVVVGVVAIVRRTTRRPTFDLAAVAVALVVVEAVMAQLRVATGALRYELPAVAVGSVVAGCAWVDATFLAAARLAARRQRRLAPPAPATDGPAVPAALASDGSAVPTALASDGPALRIRSMRWTALASLVVLVAASVPGFVGLVAAHQHGWRGARQLASLADRLPATIRQAGGRRHLVECGPIFTTNLEIPLLTWGLDLKLGEIGYAPKATGTIFSVGQEGPPVAAADRRHYTAIGSGRRSGSRSQWTVLTTCPPAGSG